MNAYGFLLAQRSCPLYKVFLPYLIEELYIFFILVLFEFLGFKKNEGDRSLSKQSTYVKNMKCVLVQISMVCLCFF